MRTSGRRFRSRVRGAGGASALLSALAAVSLLVGCETGEVAVRPAEPVPPESARNAPDLAELLRYGNTVRELDSRQLEEEYRDLVLSNTAVLPSEDIIKLSLLLSAPNAPFHDIDQATRFLRDVIQRDPFHEPEYVDLAKLLYNLLSERVYAASEDETLARLLTEARDRNEQLAEELAAVKAELDAERERRETLQGQLDALKKLEEQLSLDGLERP